MIEQLNVKEPVGGKLSLYYTEAITATAWREVFFITVDHVIDGPLGGQRADGDGDTIQRQDGMRALQCSTTIRDCQATGQDVWQLELPGILNTSPIFN